jgi:hypothetical protein
VADSASIKRAFDLAFSEMCQSDNLLVFEAHFGHALGDLYRLFELAGRPPSSESGRRAALEATAEGQAALGAAWARKFRTHKLIEVTQEADFDRYSDFYGSLAAWRPRSTFTTSTGPENRGLYYDKRLAGHHVLDTMRTAIQALLAIT